MNSEERNSLVAACGIDCGVCELYLCKDNTQLFSFLVSKGIPKEKIPCKGCRIIDGNCPVHTDTCETYSCVQQKKHDYCYECTDFPCSKLVPAADRADVLPHNLKVFNLTTIKRDGVENFCKKSMEIKTKYYKGKMVIGSGPQL
ncbi:MAG: DUF3795 domain-containing protein [Chitinivibrionales bacterium]|nr:DUF3795 domain-containing protein [Chitinivibrionales bacterium]